jgi:hypothetical protein
MTECRPPSELAKRKGECPSRSLRAGFKAIDAALAIFDLDPLSFKLKASTNSRLA